MADYEFYPVGLNSADAAQAIRAASGMAKTAGMIRSNGSGEVAAAQAGIDFGYPVLMGSGPPTQFVAGELGQFYYNLAATSAPYIYVCVDYTSQGYQWQVLGGGGDGFIIRGYYSTLDQLQSSVTQPSAGDAYGVGTAAPYTIYVFDGITHTWRNNGSLGVGGQSTGLPPHGAVGQALVKASAATGDVKWGTIDTTPPDGSVTAAKIASKAVVEAKYGDSSIPARAYKTETIPRAALAKDALYSPITMVTGTDDVEFKVASDLGKTFMVNLSSQSSAVRLLLGKTRSAEFPTGSELAVIRFNGEARIFFTGVRLVVTGETGICGGISNNTNLVYRVDVQAPYGVVALKKISSGAGSGDLWLVTGNVDVFGEVQTS